MKKVYYSWKDVQGAVLEIARQLHQDNWRPDYIVGITRGGLIPANLLSQYTGVKMLTGTMLKRSVILFVRIS